MPRIDPLFPECCHRCQHLQKPEGSCGHPLDQTLRTEFASDPDQPCPIEWQ
ncbi:MAG: hypothetical protein ABEJ74_03300 [Haloferacaceae archaeon]